MIDIYYYKFSSKFIKNLNELLHLIAFRFILQELFDLLVKKNGLGG